MRPFRLGEFLVEPEQRTLRSGETVIHLEPKVMNVLLVLADVAGNVATRDELFARVWPNAQVGDEVLSRCIYQLRTLFGDNSRTQDYIATIPKRGYKLVLIPEAVVAGDEGAHAAVPVATRPYWPVYFGIAGIALATAILIVVVVGRSRPPEEPAQHPSIVAASDPPAIIVVPYHDFSQKGDKQYFSDGITEELLNGLGQIGGLRVIGRESAVHVLKRGMSPMEIGSRLNVDAMLTGSVRVEGDNVRVSSRLVDTTSGEQIWSSISDGQLQDVLAMEDEIARAVVAELRIKLIQDVSDIRVRRTTSNNRAHRLYLEGRFYFNMRSAGALRESIDFFQQAIYEDPSFALAYSGLADANILLSQYGQLRLEQATAVAKPAIDAAIRIDPDLAEAHASLGLMLMHNGRYDKAADALRDAVAINRQYSSAHLWLGRTLDLQEQYRKALAVYRRALELDPLSPILNLNVGRMLTIAGRIEDAKTYYETGLEFGENFANLFWALGHNALIGGQLDAAAQYFQQAIDSGLTYEPQLYAHFAEVYIDQSDFEAAERYLQAAEQISAGSYWTTSVRRQMYQARGQYEQLRDYLLAMYEGLPQRKDLLVKAASAEVWRGDFNAAMQLFDGALADTGDDDLYILWDYAWGMLPALDLAFAYQQTGQSEKQAELLAKISRFIDDAAERGVATPATHYVRAIWHAQRNEIGDALRELAQAGAEGWSGSWWAEADPRLAELRTNPQFSEIAGL